MGMLRQARFRAMPPKLPSTASDLMGHVVMEVIDIIGVFTGRETVE